MKKYEVIIELEEEQLKQIYLDQDENLTEKDLPSLQELIKNEFDWLESSGIKLSEIIKEIPTPEPPPTLDVPCFCSCCEEDDYYQCDGCERYVSYCFGAAGEFYEYCDDCYCHQVIPQLHLMETYYKCVYGRSLDLPILPNNCFQ